MQSPQKAPLQFKRANSPRRKRRRSRRRKMMRTRRRSSGKKPRNVRIQRINLGENNHPRRQMVALME